jgi:hypothetical protein
MLFNHGYCNKIPRATQCGLLSAARSAHIDFYNITPASNLSIGNHADILEGGIKTITGTKLDLIISQFPLFLCFLSTRVELMTSTQKEMLGYVKTKWKTGFSIFI